MMSKQNSIGIAVNTRYLQEQSDPSDSRYAFAYTIEITNRGTEPVKLLNRHWHITDDNNKVEEVVGEGVIGQQPEIQPGQSFNYTSGAIIESAVGTMLGHYEMEADDGHRFKAEIPSFTLSVPRTLH